MHPRRGTPACTPAAGHRTPPGMHPRSGHPLPCMPPAAPEGEPGRCPAPTGGGGGSACNPRPSAPAVPRLRVSMAMVSPLRRPGWARGRLQRRAPARPVAGEEARPSRLIPAEAGGGALTFGGAALSRATLPRVEVPVQRPARRAQPGADSPTCARGGGPQSYGLSPERCPPAPPQPSKVGLSAIGPGNMLFIGAAAPALPLEASFSSLGLITFPLIDPSLGGKIPRSVADSGWTQKKPRAGGQRACVWGILYAEKAEITPTEGEEK